MAVYFVVNTLQPNWLRTPAGAASVPATAASAGKTEFSKQTESMRTAARLASPAVVSIITNPEEHPPSGPLLSPKPGDAANPDAEEDLFSGVGSGVLVSSDGYILTNAHVLEDADSIEVLLNDGRRTQANVVGTDPDTDLAVLKISLQQLPAITLGDSGALQIGDPVLAIGNPFGVGQTVTSGIVSALNRSQLGINTFENFIQTDAAINPGNSGGALVDIHGYLVGINTAIYSRTGGYMGIGFATPVSTARHVLESIIKHGEVKRGWIGVEPAEITPEMAAAFKAKPGDGVILTGILANGPAARVGLQPGDIITAVGGQPVHTVQELLNAVSALEPGKPVTLGFIRKQLPKTLELTPVQRPRPPASSAR